MGSDKENQEAAYYGLEQGTVTANADPLLLGRVKVRVPGVIDETDWAWPIVGGGSAQRGRWQVPKVGADVALWFHRGNPHGHSFYAPGHWGLARGASEAPTFIAKDPSITPETAPLLAGIEDDRYYCVLDNRPGKEAARIVDKLTGDKFEIDGRRYRMNITVTGTLSVNAGAIELNAGRVLINGRPVVPFGGPIG